MTRALAKACIALTAICTVMGMLCVALATQARHNLDLAMQASKVAHNALARERAWHQGADAVVDGARDTDAALKRGTAQLKRSTDDLALCVARLAVLQGSTTK